jgi:hypothetical protein
MSIIIKRGLEANRLSITPVQGELLFTTDTKKLFIGDGIIAGGIKLTEELFTTNHKSTLDNITSTSAINLDDIVSSLSTTIQSSAIINDLTTGGITNVLSAEQGKALKGLIDGLATGLNYKASFDASTGVLPSDIITGDFWKVSVAGTIDTLELAVGDMIIANTDVVGTTTDVNFDKIDNTESTDLIRTSNISTDLDFTIDTSSLTTRATLKTYIDNALANIDVLPTQTGNAGKFLLTDGTNTTWSNTIDGGSF